MRKAQVLEIAQSCVVNFTYCRLLLYAMKGSRSEVPLISYGIPNMIIMSQVEMISLTWTNNQFQVEVKHGNLILHGSCFLIYLE